MNASSAVLAAVRASLLLKPEKQLKLRGPEVFFLVALLSLGHSLLVDLLMTPRPRIWHFAGLHSDLAHALLVLAGSVLIASAARLKVRAWTLATLLLMQSLWLSIVLTPLLFLNIPQPWLWYGYLLWLLLSSARMTMHVLPEWSRLLSAMAASLLTALLAMYWIALPRSAYVETSAMVELDEGEQFLPPPRVELAVSAEALMFDQALMVEQALSAIEPGRPGKVEMFVLGFGSDANENVFRNEVEYLGQLAKVRFGVRTRVLTLLNNTATVDRFPLATLSNLRAALLGLRQKMNAEDVLFLYFTTHGAEEHELLVDLAPLPLDQIAPEDLAAAISDADIGHRVVVISACYSGGFITALRAPKAMVLTAARADRPSFGCGVDSDITYFGRAFLLDGLNLRRDFKSAFVLARKLVATRERSQGYTPSEPQIATGREIAQVLSELEQSWPSELPTLAFRPAEKSKKSKALEPSDRP